MQEPFISVVIPTYKRPEYLRRAIRSVVKQSFSKWEMIVADDETPAGETWKILQDISRDDARIRVVQHEKGQGQVENTNFGMARACGEWTKLLHDDDYLTADALETFAHAAGQADENVVVITCDNFREGKERQKETQTFLPLKVRHFSGKEAMYKMYMQEECGGTIPSSMMVKTGLVQGGVRFEECRDLPNAVDSWFKVLLLTHGDLLHIDSPLVVKGESDLKSITNSTARFDLDKEYEVIREMILPWVDPGFNPPPIAIVKGQVRVIRALHRLVNRHPQEAFTIACKVHYPRSWWLATKWLCRRILKL